MLFSDGCGLAVGHVVFERQCLKEMDLRSDGMAFSEEIKIEAMRRPEIASRKSTSIIQTEPEKSSFSRGGWIPQSPLLIRKRFMGSRVRPPHDGAGGNAR